MEINNLSKRSKIGIALTLLAINEEQKRKRKWMKEWLKQRKYLGHLNIFRSLDSNELLSFLRMDQNSFIELLEMVRPLITKKKHSNERSCVC